MAKITYPDKQTAVNPASPAANEVFTAADANQIKDVVNGLDDLVSANVPTVIVLTAAEMTAFSGNKSGAFLTISAGTIIINNYDDFIGRHGLSPDINLTQGNRTGIKPPGDFDNQSAPTTLTIETGQTVDTILKLS
jgi:hypothetical protein